MKNPGSRRAGKQRVRDLVYRRGRSHARPVVAHPTSIPEESTLCTACGAVYRRKTWRRSARRQGPALLGQAPRDVCPACAQIVRGPYSGRVLLPGAAAGRDEDAIRRRIANVAARARFTQPERRVVSVRRDGDGLDVLTTSEKLAHRIARELEKAFGGRATYTWSHRDRSLLAIWQGAAPETGTK